MLSRFDLNIERPISEAMKLAELDRWCHEHAHIIYHSMYGFDPSLPPIHSPATTLPAPTTTTTDNPIDETAVTATIAHVIQPQPRYPHIFSKFHWPVSWASHLQALPLPMRHTVTVWNALVHCTAAWKRRAQVGRSSLWRRQQGHRCASPLPRSLPPTGSVYL